MATMGPQYHTSGNTAMSAGSGGSRLSMMQARFREQLMLDKESRLLQMAARREEETEGTIKRVTKSNTNLSSSLASISSLNSSMGGGQGRVRKMFQERRTNGYGNSPIGRDKSYPLEPVNAGGSGGIGGRPPKPKGIVRNRGVSVDRGKAAYDNDNTRRTRGYNNYNNNYNNNNATLEQRSPIRAFKPPLSQSQHNQRTIYHHKSTSSLLDSNQNYNNGGGRGSSSSSGVYSRGHSTEHSPSPSPTQSPGRFGYRQPSPSPTHKRNANPPPRQRPSPPPRQPPPPSRQPVRSMSKQVRNSPPPEDAVDSFGDSKSKARFNPPPIRQVKSFKATQPPPPSQPQPAPTRPNRAPKPQPTSPASKSSAASSPRPSKPVPGLESCKICGRNFAPDRIEKHEVICSKSNAKAKKRKVFDPVKMRTKGTEAEKYVSKGKHLQEKPKPKKKDWKKQHEDFIATIRAAKLGKEAPPIDNSDYVECPHCQRKFSEEVADRHIPKCANISSNKPMAMRNKRR